MFIINKFDAYLYILYACIKLPEPFEWWDEYLEHIFQIMNLVEFDLTTKTFRVAADAAAAVR